MYSTTTGPRRVRRSKTQQISAEVSDANVSMAQPFPGLPLLALSLALSVVHATTSATGVGHGHIRRRRDTTRAGGTRTYPRWPPPRPLRAQQPLLPTLPGVADADTVAAACGSCDVSVHSGSPLTALLASWHTHTADNARRGRGCGHSRPPAFPTASAPRDTVAPAW
eukprot:scaffold98683_cov33-Tisochrysis_lutea.AAC.3